MGRFDLSPVFTPVTVGNGEKDEIAEVQRRPETNGSQGEMRDVAVETTLLRGRKRATWGTQFRILSGRAFKNLYRDPALLASHCILAIITACTFLSLTCPILILDAVLISASDSDCGFFFHHVTDNIAGFQNRLGE